MTRLGSGSDRSRFNMQLSLATLSDKAAQIKHSPSSSRLGLVVNIITVLNKDLNFDLPQLVLNPLYYP